LLNKKDIEMNNSMIRKFAVLALLAMFATLIGCNTVKGVGKDVERTGEVVQDVAEDASN
jgi:predicted small secreted protein